jgi:hypothetical protein
MLTSGNSTYLGEVCDDQQKKIPILLQNRNIVNTEIKTYDTALISITKEGIS